MSRILLSVVLLASAAVPAVAQDMDPLADHPEMHYFEFWPGTWTRVPTGPTDTARTFMRVRPSVHRAAYREEWGTVSGTDTTITAEALRAWDKTKARWMYTWVSGNGLYQVWDGRKFGADWYIVRPFTIGTDSYLSRQVWKPAGEGKVLRISERSDDGGTTWRERFRAEYVRTGD